MTASTAWVARLPRRRDALLAAGLAVATVAAAGLCALVDTGSRPVDSTGVLLIVALAGAVALRRWPLVALAAGAVAAVPYQLLRYPPEVVLPAAMVLLYTVAVTGSRLRAAVTGVLAVVAVLVSMRLSGDGWPGDDAVSAAGWMAVAVAFGLAVGGQRAYAAAMADRARRAEQIREQEVRRQVAEERLRIARDLHDVMAHQIAVIGMQSSVAAYLIDGREGEDDPRLAELSAALHHIAGASGTALSEVRAMLDVLRGEPPGTDEGDGSGEREAVPGLARLPELLASARAAGVAATLDRQGEPRPVPVAVDVAAYRIIQEALTNVGKHAADPSATVTLKYRPGELCLTIADRGGAPPGWDAAYGHGLTGMVERAQAAGGTLRAGTPPGGGFLVEAVLPAGARSGCSDVESGAAS